GRAKIVRPMIAAGPALHPRRGPLRVIDVLVVGDHVQGEIIEAGGVPLGPRPLRTDAVGAEPDPARGEDALGGGTMHVHVVAPRDRPPAGSLLDNADRAQGVPALYPRRAVVAAGNLLPEPVRGRGREAVEVVPSDLHQGVLAERLELRPLLEECASGDEEGDLDPRGLEQVEIAPRDLDLAESGRPLVPGAQARMMNVAGQADHPP